ncbi:MAG: DUF2254 domain-containing protein [Proteobacteria bacterium]|nr:MAG: DUF2254 domain-containing protein [Pseudomonadota bacterium]
MALFMSVDRLRVLGMRIRERLWVKPILFCALSILAVVVARAADDTSLVGIVPDTTRESLETLLSIMASSMLVIATFSVGSMVSAYNAASNSATPRSFGVVVADDVSQNALSTFVGAFIFSIVAITAVKNDVFRPAGLGVLFALTALVFGLVVFTFVRWVDRIARLGRMGSTIEKVERATAEALARRRRAPTLGGVPVRPLPRGEAVTASQVGYVQHIDMARLQAWAVAAGARVVVAALPGTFAFPDRALAYVSLPPGDEPARSADEVAAAFTIGRHRRFEDDPRFGLVVLSEIAGRALSPAVNDPGTAVQVLGVLVRLFAQWAAPASGEDTAACDRVEVPALSVRDMFDDAFTAIARDGAGTLEVAIRLQKALRALAGLGGPSMRAAAEDHARLALERATHTLALPADCAQVRDAAARRDD